VYKNAAPQLAHRATCYFFFPTETTTWCAGAQVPSSKKTRIFNPSRAAFILYRPQAESEKDVLSYNEEAWRILSLSLADRQGETDLSAELRSLCCKWKQLLEEGSKENPITDFTVFFQSKRRRYAVRGAVLSDPLSSQQNPSQYLFILERTSPEKMNLSMIFRNLNLAPREQEIVRLLLAGSSNKEIADSLGISLNTVKGYMKLLSRKLGVNNRAGIIAAVLAAK
jgi:DNA-binding CsgD family transcriptional regulator